MNKEDYFKYYIQGSDHYLIPKDVFIELFSEMENWKEESKQLKAKLEMYENGVYYSSENDKLKEVIKEAREYINSNPNVFYDEYLIDVETLKNNECIDDTVGEIKFISNLLQILAKAKGEMNNE